MIPHKVLVTGGTGFIGSYLARKLIEENIKVTLLDLSPNKKRIQDILDKVDIVEMDILGEEELGKLLEKEHYDVIVHAAAVLSMKAEEEKTTAFKTNIEGTFNVFEAFDSKCIKIRKRKLERRHFKTCI